MHIYSSNIAVQKTFFFCQNDKKTQTHIPKINKCKQWKDATKRAYCGINAFKEIKQVIVKCGSFCVIIISAHTQRPLHWSIIQTPAGHLIQVHWC